MPKRSFGSLIILALILFVSTQANGLTLQEAYKKSVSNTGQLKNYVLNQEKSRAVATQLISETLPSLTATSTGSWEDDSKSGFQSELNNWSSTTKLSVTQPLFQGGSEYFAFHSAGLNEEIADSEKKQAEASLFYEVGKVFYEALALESDLRFLSEQKNILEERIKYIAGRVKIGRSKKTELLASQSQHARVASEIEDLKSQIQVKRSSLSEWMGESATMDLVDNIPLNNLRLPILNSKQSFPALEILNLKAELASKESSALASTYLPRVDLIGNYYFKRSIANEGTDWDLGITATWDLFSGGSEEAKRRIKAIEAEQLSNTASDERRNFSFKTQSLFSKFESEKRQYSLLEESVKLAKQNYSEHQKEFRNGLVGNLDVLRALDELLTAQRNFDRIRFAAKTTFLEFHKEIGKVP
ncbi:MAG: TolC family protein [Bdellovibrionales bacterium]|nr:TolC family protein [Bdellovibrionales bacterium]